MILKRITQNMWYSHYIIQMPLNEIGKPAFIIHSNDM